MSEAATAGTGGIERQESARSNASKISEVVWEAERAYLRVCRGGLTKKPFGELDDVTKNQIVARTALAMGYPRYNAAQIHDLWRQDMVNRGWGYGETRNTRDKTDPRVRPFYELAHEEMVRANLALVIIRELQNAIDG